MLIVFAKRNIVEERSLSPSAFLPAISMKTPGTTSDIVANYSVGISAAMAVHVIVTEHIVIRFEFFRALMYCAFFLHKLLAVGLPPLAKVPALVIIVVPMGQFATAI